MSRLTVLALMMASLAAFLTLRFVALDVWRVQGRSMEPVLTQGRLILVNRLAFGLRAGGAYLLRWSEPKVGDLLIFRSPIGGGLSAKQYVALAGERIAPDWSLRGSHVPEGHIVVLGRNALASIDSRTFGAPAVDRVVASVVTF